MELGEKTIVLFTGGGSGGHVYPLLAVGEELKKLAVANKLVVEIEYFGPEDEYAEILRAAGFEIKGVVSGKLRRYFSIENMLDIPKLFIGIVDALFKVYWLMPDVIFSKGGTGALPIVIAGWFYRIPVMIHESDATPGLTNLLSAWFASRVAVSFQSALKYFNPQKSAWIGTPIRKEMLIHPDKNSAKEELGFDAKTPLTLILGGSQGSVRINEFILTNLKGILKETQVLHQTGEANFHDVERLSRAALTDLSFAETVKSRYKPMAYLDRSTMIRALAATDLVVARAGSSTIFEAAVFGKPMILIPLLEAANDHQRVNAYQVAGSGAAIVIEEPNLLPELFLSQLRSLLSKPDVLNKMSVASENFFKPGAAEVIAQELLNLA